MLAQCTRCQKTFVTDHFGRQRCPKCDGEVYIADPMKPEDPEALGALGTTSAGGPNDAPIFGDNESIPWERRHEIGWFKALFETIKLSLTEPRAFYGRVRSDRVGSAHLYFVLVLIVPLSLSTLIGALIPASPPSADGVAEMDSALRQALDNARPSLDKLGLPGNDELLKTIHKMSENAIISIVMMGLFAMAALYIATAITHVMLLVTGRGKGGWNATLCAFAYSFGSGPLFALSFVGLLLAVGVFVTTVCWSSALQVVGLARMHRISTGWATFSLVAPGVIMMTCCSCGSFALAASMMR